MAIWTKTVVYRSRSQEDWAKARQLLSEAGVENQPFAAEEPPVAGCGAKIHPGRMFHTDRFPSTIYRIEVSPSDAEKAKKILNGKVMPVLPIGYGI